MKNNKINYSTFEVLTLIKPLWYFHLINDNYRLLQNVDDSIKLDKNYESNDSAKLEMYFVLLMNGFIPKKSDVGFKSTLKLNHQPSIIDEFRFIRKNFNVAWSLIYLFYCVFILRKPFVGIYSFLKNLKVKRIPITSNLIGEIQISNNDGLSIINNDVHVRVIIPTYNRYNYLHDLLKDLENQNYSNFSVTVVDQSNPFEESFYDKFNLKINLIRQDIPALWHARNIAIQESNEEIIALLDDDSRIKPDWLKKHLQCLDYYDADVSAGISISTHGSKTPENYFIYRLADQLDTGNVVLYRYVFKSCGLFDERYEGMRKGDAEYGLRIYKNGLLSISNPASQRIHLKVKQGGLRQMGSWDSLRPTSILKPRPIPSVLYYSRTYFGKQNSLKYLFTHIPFSLTTYKSKGNKLSILISLMVFIILFPFVAYQVICSWKLSSVMLKEGSKIPQIV